MAADVGPLFAAPPPLTPEPEAVELLLLVLLLLLLLLDAVAALSFGLTSAIFGARSMGNRLPVLLFMAFGGSTRSRLGHGLGLAWAC